jgi:hypothetical protein
MFGVSLIALLSAAMLVADANPVGNSGPCAPKPALARALSRAVSAWQVVTTPVLDSGDRASFEKDHPGACPGMVELNFFGDALPTTVLSVVNGTKAKLVLARQRSPDRWSIQTLEESDGRPVVWVEKRGVFSDVHGEKKLTVVREGVVWCGYGSWAILYAWVGNRVEKIWLAD